MFEEFWWIFPLCMMIFCFIMMWGGKGMRMCGYGARNAEQNDNKTDTAMEILEKRYAGGEIDKGEYEDKRKALTQKGEDNE